MNNFIKARPAEKQKTVQTNWENIKDTPKGLAKVEGVITSALELKEPRNSNPYYLAFFQLEGIDTEIPVIFKLDSSVDPSEQSPPAIPPRAKVLLEGK